MIALTLRRFARASGWTIGHLSAGGEALCFTLEDPDRLLVGLPKLPKRTAIPHGHYDVRMTPSARFNRVTPQLMDVPGFAGVRIHPGNSAADTEGCVLPGRAADLFAGLVRESAKAYAELFSAIDVAGGARIAILPADTDPVYVARLKAAWEKDYQQGVA